MYLKELEIFGFKSFPQKTSLTFESGITVVVGPNGCGKSNVFDAIKWSLGEQSPKSLRGTKMEDIIFNGTENQQPLNYAEVCLTFCNEDKYLPIDYKEVAVGRRLYRSGESQYFINKNPVRLKDVQELFMGTGIGEATYSFIEQGKIEIFLSYKPEDKRLIFDEASGIVKYKDRRKEAFKKLKEAEDNLIRLEDILSEVRRQIRYLERQVEKAKKFKEVQFELIETEKKIATLQSDSLKVKINRLLDGLNDFQEKQNQKDTQLSDANTKSEQLQNEAKVLRSKLEEATTTVVSLRAQSQSANNNIVVYKQRVNELDQRNVFIEQTKRDLDARLKLQEEKNKEETARFQSIEASVTEFTTSIKALESEKLQINQAIDEAKKTIAGEKTNILNLESQRVQSHNTLIEIQTNLNTLLNRKKRLLLDTARLDTLLTENSDKLETAKSDLTSAQMRVSELESDRSALRAREKELRVLEENIRNASVDKEKELLELNATFEFLKDLRIKYETFSVKKKITVIFDEEPKDINKLVASLVDVEFKEEGGHYKAVIEAKVVSFEEEQLEEKISIVKTELAGLKVKLSELGSDKENLSTQLLSLNSNLEEEKRTLHEKMQEQDTLEREVLRLKEEAEILNQEKTSTLEDINYSQTKQTELEGELSAHDESLKEANNTLTNCQEIIASSSEKIKEIDISTTKSNGEIQSLYKEKETLGSKISYFQDELNSLRGNLEQIDKEKQENQAQGLSLTSQIEDLKKQIVEGAVSVEDFTNKKKDLEAQEKTINEEINKVRELISASDKDVAEVRSSIYNKKLEIQTLEYEKEKIKDYLNQVYKIEFQPLEIDSITDSLEDLNTSKEKMQKRVKSLGEVNLVAIEEFEELKQRNDYLENQKQDLITSKENLKKAIQKINRTSKEIFLKTFEKIQGEFKKNFKFLFNGGRANLILLDPDDVLESGVEIEVQPPGKKLQNISLLSGGEKSLTAISLIFAIFQVKPSPLCVLDEIDAPLDEANVDRFNHLLKEFAKRSQFVVITHNKKTMANADTLYGVTMQERGISKLVSVKFAQEEQEAQEAAT